MQFVAIRGDAGWGTGRDAGWDAGWDADGDGDGDGDGTTMGIGAPNAKRRYQSFST